MASKFEAKTVKRKRLAWSEVSEAALLDLWLDRVVELREQRKKGHIYAEMAVQLLKLGFSYSPRDVHVKLQNFTQRYRKEKEAMGAPGGSPSTWSQYGRVHQIIGGFKANSVAEVKLENIDDSSISSLLSSPLPSPSSPLPPVSPSPGPSTSASSIEPAKKKRKLDFRATIMENFEKLSADISEHLKKSEENERELIAIENKKADSLASIAKDNAELKNALITYIKKNTLLFLNKK